jgi:tetratricopeptide (TPR) repeat protein
MNRIQLHQASAFLVIAALCITARPARAVSRQAQNTASPQQSSAKQRSDDEEKKLLAAVQEAESPETKPTDLTKTLENLATFYQIHNRKVELSSTLDREIVVADKSWPPDDHDLLQTLRKIAGGYTMCNQRTRAIQIYQRILDVDMKTSGLMSRDVASDYLELGRIAMFIPDSPDAEAYLMKALAIDQVRKSESDSLNVVLALSTIAKIQRNPEKADVVLDRALQALKLNPDQNAHEISSILMDRANNASSRRDINSAIDFAQQSLEIDERLYGSNNPFLIGKITFLANNYMRRGDDGPAETSLQRALQLADSNEKDTQHVQRIQPLTILARLYQQEKKYPESEAAIKAVTDLITASRGADSPTLSGPALQLAQLYEVQNRNAEAETQFRHAIALLESQKGAEPLELPNYLAAYASFLKKMNRNEESEKLLERARDIVQKRRTAVQNQTPQI